MSKELLYRYFIALREIYQNVCPEVPGNPLDVIFLPVPKVEGNITSQGFQGIGGQTNLYIYQEAKKKTVMLHFTCENAWKLIWNFRGNVTPADPRDNMRNIVCTLINCPSLVQSGVLLILKISAGNIIQLLTGDEGNIWYVGPEDKMLPKAEGNILAEGPTYHILPEYPVNNCFVIPSLG